MKGGKRTYNQSKEKSKVKEPVAVYMNSIIAPVGAIGLMGMESEKGFAEIKNEKDFISLIRTGIPKQAMDNLMDRTGLSANEMAAITHTSDRTLRRYTPKQKLSQDQSERIIEVARLYSRGINVFGGILEFKEWMNMSLLPLGNKKPKEFLDTSLGIGMLMDELGRIEHGIFA